MEHMCIRYVNLTDRSVIFECLGKESNNVQGSDILILSSCKLVRVHISYLQSLGGSSPLCAITSITNDIRYRSQTQQNLLMSTRSSE